MIQHYIAAVSRALGGLVNLLTAWALPLTLACGFLLVARVLVLLFGRNAALSEPMTGRQLWSALAGYGAIGLLLVVGWAALATTRMLAQQDIRWRQSVDSTKNPVPDAPPVMQSGPSVAALRERTYARTLTLPPSFLNRLGAEGVGVLAPYLSDPTSENVVRLRDTFRRSGRNAVFTRFSTVREEEPIAFSDSKIKVSFRPLAGRAYDATFEGHYFFGNADAKARPVHFLFSLPDAGTIRDLKISVGAQTLAEPTDSGTYEWKDTLQPGETREAIVLYHVTGARVWSYDLGSERRRVQQFQLDVEAGGDVEFLRGSLQPTSQSGRNLSWQLSNVVTAQKAALVFPADDLDGKLYLQALSALPATFLLFFVAVLACASASINASATKNEGSANEAIQKETESLTPGRLAAALTGFGFGLGTSTVAATYLGPVAGLLVGPLLGALLSLAILGRRYAMAAIPVALLPVTFLSAQNSGLLIFGLCALTLLAGISMKRNPKSKSPLAAREV